MTHDLRLGIIGAGNLASSRIYPCLHALPVELVAVCDLDRARAERNARKFGGQQVYTDHRRMLAEAELDAVVICVGPEAHHTLAIEAMEAGLPVYTEKPPAITAAAAREVLEASRSLHKICMTAFKKRFAPVYQKARTAIIEGNFGTPTLLSVNRASGPYSNQPDNPRSQFLLDFCIHTIDLARYLCGEVAEVYARKSSESTYAVHLSFRNGAFGLLALSAHGNWSVSMEKVELTGAPGQFLSIENSIQFLRFSHKTPVDWHIPNFSTAGGDSLVETGFLPELAAFVAAVQDGHEPESSISSAYRTMCLYEAISRSAREQRIITLNENGEEG